MKRFTLYAISAVFVLIVVYTPVFYVFHNGIRTVELINGRHYDKLDVRYNYITWRFNFIYSGLIRLNARILGYKPELSVFFPMAENSLETFYKEANGAMP